MSNPTEAQLLLAHPGHELLLQGWIGRTKPLVHVLTDGSGHSGVSRIGMTTEVVANAGARPGTIFGRLSDREAYAMILEANIPLLLSVVMDLATAIGTWRSKLIVCDAVEGYNPVHDLCRLIAGAAIEMANLDVKQYEYAVVNGPASIDVAGEDVLRFEIDDSAFAAKLQTAARFSRVLPDAEELLSRHGRESYRREIFRRVIDWTDLGADDAPSYERVGEERVAADRYGGVIRKAEHMVPLRDALRASVRRRQCVS
jgi:hypothetical protein